MESPSILIRNGRVVTATDDVVADVLVVGEQIASVGLAVDRPVDRVIDASGKLVLPGCIDVHTHLDMPLREGVVTADDFLSGQTAAAFGGTTCHVDFATQERGSTLASALEAWHAKREGRSVIDNGFHMAVTDLSRPELMEELASLAAHGVSSFKLYLTYEALRVDDGVLFRAMQVAAGSGALVMVHAENGDVIDVLVQAALSQGRTEPRWHAATRPAATEGEAVNRSIQLARLAGCPLYIVHVSCREALEPIEEARGKGWAVWGETCPQYLFVSSDDLDREGFEGAKYVFTPPARTKADQEALWDACRRDVLQVISTDHCSFLFHGQKTLGRHDFSQIPNGAPGLETRLELVHSFGVREGRIGLNRMVDLLATSPAKLFGLYPRKGTIAPGSDADLVVFDPERERTISAATHHSRADYTLYEGMTVTGVPEVVLRRGEVIVEGDRLLASPGSGRFVARARFGERLEPAP